MNNIKISNNFKLKEFESPDTNEVKVDEELLRKLEELRKRINDYLNTKDTPLIINSGYRTWEHHKRIYVEKFGNAWKEHISKDSLHLKGKATDLRKPTNMSINKFTKLAEEVDFDGIGKYNWGIHVDVRGNGPARWNNR